MLGRSLVGTLLLLCLAACYTCQHIPKVYPKYMQCAAPWGQLKMGGGATICQQGCAMTSLCMGLTGKGYTIGGKTIDPLVMNEWLIEHHGYYCAAGDCNNLNLTLPDTIGSHIGDIIFVSENEKPADSLFLVKWLLEENIAIAHVRNQSHFVLVTGWEEPARGKEVSSFSVNDPFYPEELYPYESMADIILYKMKENNDNDNN